MRIRLAERSDIDQLIKLRWDSTIEFDVENKIDQEDYETFEQECHRFLEQAITDERWYIWVAEENGVILSNIYIELIYKVPRPGRITYPFAYMTNVYTLVESRNKGIGSKLLSIINEWVEDQNFEFVIVWPSDDSGDYYTRNGYQLCEGPLEYRPLKS